MEVDDHEFPEESEVEGSNAADFSDDEVVDFKQAGKAKKKKESSKLLKEKFQLTMSRLLWMVL